MFAGRNISNFLKRVVDGVADGDESAADELPELHATCAGLKAFCTTWTAALIEDCRKCCGGQGYMRSSGIADLSTSYVGAVTAEGEAVILALQTARYLIKAVEQARRGETPAGAASYVADSNEDAASSAAIATSAGSFVGRTSDAIVTLMRLRARLVALDLAADFGAATARGLSFDEALNSVAVLGVHASECHCMYVMAKNAAEALPQFVTDLPARTALTALLELVLLQNIQENGSDFVGLLDRAAVRQVHADIMTLLDQIRPDAVALSDSFGFTDHHLKSTLGRHDGNVYEAIYEEAKASPLNGTRMVGWDKLKEVLDMDFIRTNKILQRHVPVSARSSRL
jgi:acyl-CoA oxidase